VETGGEDLSVFERGCNRREKLFLTGSDVLSSNVSVAGKVVADQPRKNKKN